MENKLRNPDASFDSGDIRNRYFRKYRSLRLRCLAIGIWKRGWLGLHTVITTQLAREGRSRRWRAHTQARLGLGSLSRLPPSSNPPPPETQSGGRCVFYLLVSRSPASSRWSLWSRHVSTSILVHPSHRQQRRKGCSLSRGTPQKRNPFPRHSAKENQTSYPCCP